MRVICYNSHWFVQCRLKIWTKMHCENEVFVTMAVIWLHSYEKIM